MTLAQILPLAFGLALLLVASRPVAADEEPVLVDSFGMWTLEELGYDDLMLPVSEEMTQTSGGKISQRSISYALPEGASQGPDNWYMIHLHFKVDFAAESENGIALVSSLLNGSGAAQIEFEVDGTDDPLRISWSTVDLLNGGIEQVTSSPSIEVFFSNYIGFDGVTPGENTLTFQLETYGGVNGGVNVESLRIFKDSAIEYTPLSPPDLDLELKLPDKRVRPDDVFDIGYELNNVGDRPAKDVVVGVIYPPEGFTLIGETPHSYSSITGSVEGVFTLKAIGEGTHLIVLGAESPSSQPVAEIQVVVYPPGRTFLTKGRLWVAVPLILLSALLIAVVGRRLANSSRVR